MKRFLASLVALAGLAAGLVALPRHDAESALFANHYPVASCTPVPLTITERQNAVTPVGDATLSTSLTITLPAAVTNGDTVVGYVSYDTGSSPAISSIVDNQGNVYSVIDTINDVAHQQGNTSFYRPNIVNAPTSVTVNFTVATTFRFGLLDELSNVLTVAPLDGHAAQVQTTPGTGTNAVTSGNITTTTAGTFIWGGASYLGLGVGVTIATGTGFTVGAGSTSYMLSEHKLLASAGTTAATFTLSTAGHDTLTAIAAFKPAQSCSTPPPPAPTLAFGAFSDGDASGEGKTEALEAFIGRTGIYAVEFGGAASSSDFTGSTGFEFSLWPNGRQLLYSQPLIWDAGSPSADAALLHSAATGGLDTQYASVASSIAAAAANGKVFVIRIGWELNGDWYPWSIHSELGYGTAADYAAAWHRFATIIRAAYPAAKFDWNQNWSQMDPSAAYPGDDVVDYVTMDVYENSTYTTGSCTSRWNGFVSAGSLASLTTLQTFATAHGKPMAIPEYASNYNDGCFIQNMHDWVVARNFAYQSYWNSTSAFNGLLANYPVNSATFCTNWKLTGATCSTGAVSNPPYIPSAGTPPALGNGDSFTTDTVGYSLYARYLFDPNATPTNAADVTVGTLGQLGTYFNPLYSSNVTFFSGNNEWQRYTTSFTSTAHQWTPGTTGNPGSLNLVATAPGGINNGGITSGMIAMKTLIEAGTTAPVSNHGIAMQAIIKGSGRPGDFPAFWCYEFNNGSVTGGPNEQDFWEGMVSDNGVWNTQVFQDGTGITPGTLTSTAYNAPGWDGFKVSPLPGGADYATGFHKMQMVWNTAGFAVYFDGVMMRRFNYTYNASTHTECYINYALTGNGTVPSGQTVTQAGPFPRQISVQEWAIYTAP